MKLGQGVAEIAARFGDRTTGETTVGLGGLDRRDQRRGSQGHGRSADTQLLALATPKQQREWMKLYRDKSRYAPQGDQLKAWLLGGAAISTEVALFPLADYTGRIVADLFGEQSYFDDAAQFWTLQNQAIAELRESLLAKGWAKVEVLETGHYFRGWEYQRTTKQDGGWVLLLPQRNGEVLVHEGLLPPKEVQRQAGGRRASRVARRRTRTRPNPPGARPLTPCRIMLRCTRRRRCELPSCKIPPSPCGWRWRV